MMYGYGSGMGLIWILVIFAILLPSVMLAAALIGAQLRHPPHTHELPPSEAERLLAGRYARGEIDTDEYMHRLAALRAEQR
jgi:putative membrane protein